MITTDRLHGLTRSAKKMMTSEYLRRLDVQGHLKVKEALRRWDPIGVYDEGTGWPDDEYDSYAGPLVSMLDQGYPKEEMMKYLKDCAEGAMEVPFDPDHTSEILDELRAFWPRWKKDIREFGPSYLVREPGAEPGEGGNSE